MMIQFNTFNVATISQYERNEDYTERSMEALNIRNLVSYTNFAAVFGANPC